MVTSRRSISAAIGLFFVAPFVAEYLLGDLPLTLLSALIVLAPMYGGGALLIREIARRTGRGWPTIFLLGAAYALIEEGFTDQSLFNPDLFGMHMHLLSHAWIPALGIGAWWTLFMLNLHPFWSIGVSIVLVEGLFPSSAQTPWLGRVATVVFVVLFALGLAANTSYSLHHSHFAASIPQFVVTGLICILFIAAALFLPLPDPQQKPGAVPTSWLTGAAAFLLGSAVFITPPSWNWGACASLVAVDLLFLSLVSVFSRRAEWTAMHTLSLGAGGALVYGVHAFMGAPVASASRVVVRCGNAIFLAVALGLIVAGVLRTRKWIAAEEV